jgi:SAM-dependent methyltransferase
MSNETHAPDAEAPGQWSHERQFFDAAAQLAGPFDLVAVERRYRRALSSPLYPLEAAYSLLGDICGKRVLDVGCGHGEHSLLFGAWGADVLGVDISPGSIGLCRKRAEAFPAAGRVEFVNAPVESLTAGSDRFDAIWTCAFLHHVLDRLPAVLEIFDHLLADGGKVIFMEPVRLSGWLKRARRIVPVAAAGTPDERPLEESDLTAVEERFSLHETRLFGPVSRAADRFGLSNAYEAAPAYRRYCSDVAYRIDRTLMRHPSLRGAGMIMVSRLARRSTAPT